MIKIKARKSLRKLLLCTAIALSSCEKKEPKYVPGVIVEEIFYRGQRGGLGQLDRPDACHFVVEGEDKKRYLLITTNWDARYSAAKYNEGDRLEINVNSRMVRNLD